MNRNGDQVETVIIGGGHAGLTMSYFLGQRGLEHVVLERGRVGERWISERWDSFHFQFPNSTIELPGYKYQTDDLDGFVPAGNRSLYSRIRRLHKSPGEMRRQRHGVGELGKFEALFAAYERRRH